MKFKNLIKLCLIWVLVSCGQGQSQEATPEKNNDLNPVERDELLKVLQSTERFFEIRFYCEKTRGSFSPGTPSCSCPADMQFVGQGQPGCYPYHQVSFPLEGRQRVLTRSESQAAYPVDLFYLNGSMVDAESVLWKPYIHVPQKISLYDLKDLDVQRILGFFNLSDIENPIATFSDIYNPSIVDTDYRDQGKNLHQQIEAHLKRRFPFTAAEFSSLENKDWHKVDFHPRKCLIHCELDKEIKNATHSLKWKKVIRGGQVFRQWMEVQSQDSYYHQYVIPVVNARRIDAVLKIEVKADLGKIVNATTVFQKGKARTFQWALLENLQQKQYAKQLAVGEIWKNSESKILLCDSDIPLEQLTENQREKLALFPAGNSTSFYGMLDTREHFLNEYQELINANQNGVLHTSGMGHATSLLKFAREHSVIPFGIYPCLGMIKKWASRASLKGVKVVNLSAAEEVHSINACRQKQYAEDIQRFGHSFLWVMSADNVAQEVTPAKSTSCPQKEVYWNSNAIVVSHPRMEYGAKFIDLIIRSGRMGYSQSASESTMIVSQIANDLFNEFPKATAKIIKKALILGADFDKYQAHKSRAGGDINLSRTRKIIAELIRKPHTSMERIVRKYFSYWDNEEEKFAHIKEYYVHY